MSIGNPSRDEIKGWWAEVIAEIASTHDGPKLKLPAMFGVEQSTLNRWMNAKMVPEAEDIARIALKWGYSVDWIITHRGPKKVGERERSLDEAYEEGRRAGHLEAWTELKRVADDHLALPATADVADEALHQASEEKQGRPRRRKRGSR